jgi:hypothetical protein
MQHIDLSSYEGVDDLAITHRSSAEYKTMRSSMIPGIITEEPIDLRSLCPSGIGFMAQHEADDMYSSLATSDQYLHVKRFSPREGQGHTIKEFLRQVADELRDRADSQKEVRSCWILEYDPSYHDTTIVVLERYSSRAVCQKLDAILLPSL